MKRPLHWTTHFIVYILIIVVLALLFIFWRTGILAEITGSFTSLFS